MQFEFLEGKFKSSETQEGPLSLKLVSHSLTGVSSDVSSDVSSLKFRRSPGSSSRSWQREPGGIAVLPFLRPSRDWSGPPGCPPNEDLCGPRGPQSCQ